jgi:hypothetical protein
MKQSIFYFLVATSMSFTVKAQFIDASKVPQTVKSTFEKRYPGIIQQWEFEEEKFDAEFKQDGKKHEILFDRKGNSAEKIAIEDAPIPMKDYINTHYSNEKLKKVKKLQNANEEISYLAIINNKTLRFDNRGKFIEEIIN